MLHAHLFKSRDCPRLRFAAVKSKIERAERHILDHRGHEQLVVRILKNQPDLLAHTDQVPGLHRHAADADVTVSRQQSVQVQHESCLARTVGTENRHGLAWKQLEVDPIERHRAVVVLKVEIADFDERPHQIQTSMAARVPASNKTAPARKTASAARKAWRESVWKRS